MKRLKGPELKMPDLKVPPVLADVYLDLRDRRLLPLIALVAVAILAVPFLLGSDPEAPPPPVASEAGNEEVAPGNFAVVEAKPGLRAYRKRLRARTPTNPFKQRYTSLPEKAQLQSTTATSSTTSGGGGSDQVSVTDVDESITEESVTPSGGDSGEGGGSTGGSNPGGGSGGSPGKIEPDDPGLRFFAFRPDVLFGVAGSGELNERVDLPLGTLMPERNPVVVFVGVSEDGRRVAFDVSPEVAMVKGPGRCIGGAQSCSLLILREGQSADILTGTPGRSFHLKILRIDFVEVDRPKPASSSAAGQRWGFSYSFSK